MQLLHKNLLPNSHLIIVVIVAARIQKAVLIATALTIYCMVNGLNSYVLLEMMVLLIEFSEKDIGAAL